MSTIDNRIARLELDNAQFERAAQTTLNTLGKLEQGLRFDDVSTGFAHLGRTISSVGSSAFAPLTKAIDNVSSHFNMKTLLMATGIQEIERRVINSATNIVNSISFGPVLDGFREYELKMGSVQVIMSSTGESLETVNKYLEELNVYADKTIYSFADMTANIGKFTNAGVKLNDAVAAIQGISNLAALSGANAQQASHAMYNFAQALASGYVKLIDWKSIENAQMATVEFKQALLDTAESLGTVEKSADGYYHTLTTSGTGQTATLTATKNFNDSLQSQWLTTDVLIKTLARYSNEQDELGKRAYAAAQDVKTFTQLMDTLKEAVGSGWARTFELFIGDFNQAKKLFTEISDVVGGFINNSADARNNFWEAVLGGVTAISDVQEAVNSVVAGEEVQQGLEETRSTLERIRDLATDIIRGDYGNGEDRITALTTAGYDAELAQRYVNILHEITEGTWNLSDASYEAADAALAQFLQLSDLSDEQLRETGLTEEQIGDLRDLKEEYDNVSEAIQETGSSIEGMTYREVLIDSFRNIFTGLAKAINTVKSAFRDIFPPITVQAVQNAIASFHRLTEGMIMSDETAGHLTDIFHGFFSVLDMIKMGLGAVHQALAPVREALGTIFNAVKTFVLEGGGELGRMLTNIRNYLKGGEVTLEGFIDLLSPLGSILDRFIDMSTSIISDVVGPTLGSVGSAIAKFFSDIPGFISSTWPKVETFFGGLRDALVNTKSETSGLSDRLKAFFSNYEFSNILHFNDIIDWLADKISKLKKALADFLSSTGLDHPFNTIGNALKNFFGSFSVTAYGDEVDEFGNVVNDLAEIDGGGLSGVLSGIAKFALGIGTSISNAFSSIKDKMSSFTFDTSSIKSTIGSIWQGIKDVLSWFADAGGSLLTSLPSMFSTGLGWVSSAWDAVTGWVSGIIDYLSASLPSVPSSLLENLKTIGSTIWGAIKSFFGSFSMTVNAAEVEGIDETFETFETVDSLANMDDSKTSTIKTILSKLSEIWNAVKEFVVTLDYEKLLSTIETITKIHLFSSIANFFSDINTMSTSISKVIKKLPKIAKGFSDAWKKEGIDVTIKNVGSVFGDAVGQIKKNSITTTIRDLAIALLSISASLFIIAQIPADRLEDSLIALGLCAGGLAAFAIVAKAFQLDKLHGLAITVVGIGAAVFLLAEAVKVVSNVDPNTIGQGLLGVAGAMILLGFVVDGLGDANNHFGIGKGLGIVLLAASLLIIAQAVKSFSKLSFPQLGQGLLAIAASLIVIGLALKTFTASVTSNHLSIGQTNLASIGAGMVLLSIGLLALAGDIKIWSYLPIDEIGGALLSLFVSIAAIGTAMRAFPQQGVLAAAVGMVLLAPAIAVIGATLGLMTLADPARAIASAVAIAGIIGAFGGIAYVTKAGDMIASAAAMLILAPAIVAIGAALSLMTLTNAGDLLITAGVIGAFVAGMALLAEHVSGAAAGATAILELAIALGILTPVLMYMTGVEWDTILAGLSRLAALAGGLFLLGEVMNFMSTPALKLTAAFAILVVGVIALIAAIVLLAPAMEEAFSRFLATKDSLIAMLPQVISGAIAVAAAFIEGLAYGIATSGPKLLEAFQKLFASFISARLQWISDMLGWLGDLPFIGEIFGGIFGGISDKLEEWANSLNDILFGDIAKSAESAGKEVPTALGHGILSNKESAKKPAKAVGDEAIAAMRESAQNAEAAGEEFPDKVGTGIYRRGPYVKQAVTDVSDDAVETVESKVGDVINLFDDAADSAEQSSTDMATSIMSGFSGLADFGGTEMEEMMNNMLSSLGSGASEAGGLSSDFVDNIMASFGDLDGFDIGEGFSSDMLAGLMSGEGDLSYFSSNFSNILGANFSSIDGSAIGGELMRELMNGMTSNSGSVSTAVNNIKKTVTNGLGNIDVSSGGRTADSTLASGLNGSAGLVNSAANNVKNGMVNNLDGTKQASNKGYANGQSFANGVSWTRDLAAAAGSDMSNQALIALLNTYGFQVNGNTDARSFINGLLAYTGSANSAGASLAYNARSGAYDYSGMYNAGYSSAAGFVAGIGAQQSNVSYTAHALAQTARSNLNVAVPMAFDRLLPESEESLRNIAEVVDTMPAKFDEIGDHAMEAIKKSSKTINDIINGDFIVDPTIRPVLDLTDVQNGAQQIDNILSNGAYSLNGSLDYLNAAANKMSNTSSSTSLAATIDGIRTELDSINQFIREQAAINSELVMYSTNNINMDGRAISSILSRNVVERISSDQLTKLKAVGA